jgi:sortase (surface protein transpeptidase)
VESESDLFKALEKHKVGDVITLHVMRSGANVGGELRKVTETDVQLRLSAPGSSGVVEYKSPVP